MSLSAKKSIVWCIGVVLLLAAGPVRAENWSQWRGPNFDGTTAETNLPATWSKTENVAWSTPMPGATASTPIIWGDRVFTTSVNKSKDLLAMCLDAGSGKVLWSDKTGKDRRVAGSNHNMSSPSPVTDGKSVFFLFGTGDMVAYDFKGKRLWSRDIEKDYGPFILKWGYGSSPLLHKDKVYVQVLQNKKPGEYGVKGHTGKVVDSYLLALDVATGKTLWKHVRPTDAKGESTESYSTVLHCCANSRAANRSSYTALSTSPGTIRKRARSCGGGNSCRKTASHGSGWCHRRLPATACCISGAPGGGGSMRSARPARDS